MTLLTLHDTFTIAFVSFLLLNPKTEIQKMTFLTFHDTFTIAFVSFLLLNPQNRNSENDIFDIP